MNARTSTCRRCGRTIDLFRGLWWGGDDDFQCPDGEERHTPDNEVNTVIATTARPFVEELREIVGDMIEDYRTTMDEISVPTREFMQKHVLLILDRPGATSQEVIEALGDTLMWMILLGREHAARGYSSPIRKDDTDIDDLVGDDELADLIDGDDDDE